MKTDKRQGLTLCAALVISACAAHPDPIIDEQGVNMAQYQRDLADCKHYADNISVTKGAAKGAAVGAVVGAAAGAIGGNAGQGAGYGGLSGGTRSGIQNKNTKEQVVKRCISGRGYRVLN